jgi:hypothetical protein
LGHILVEATEAASGKAPFIFTPDNTLLIAWGSGSVRFYRTRDGQLVHQIAVGAEDVAIGPRQHLLSLVRGGLPACATRLFS